MWENNRIHTISHSSLLALADNRIPAVRIENFATARETERLTDALLRQASRTHSIEEVARLGISQYEQGVRATKANYFSLARELNEKFSRIYQCSFSPLKRVIDKFAALGFDADVMSEPGFGPYFAGNGKLRNGYSPVHVDFAAQDSEGWAIAEAKAQLAWNLYLRVPEEGGELLIWNKIWHPGDDRHQVENNYYYHEEVVNACEKLTVTVKPGEVLILNSRNYHAVAAAENRLAFGSFISVFDDKRLRLWS